MGSCNHASFILYNTLKKFDLVPALNYYLYDLSLCCGYHDDVVCVVNTLSSHSLNKAQIKSTELFEISFATSTMDRLFESARTGNVWELRQLILENSLILHTVALSSVDNPLHIACLAGHLDYVKELLRSKPEFAMELSSEGHTPMHMASANGHLEVVRELIKIDHQLCRRRDTNGRTPFHLAALKGKVNVLEELVSSCAESIEDLTPQGETALHLAIRYSQFESFSFMVDCVGTTNKGEMLNKKDEQGNTLLHLGTWKKQRQVIESLLANRSENSHPLEVNAINRSGLTPLDVLLVFPSEAGDREMQELLQRAGAMRAQELDDSYPQTCTQIPNNPTPRNRNNLVDYFKFHRGRDSPSSVRDALLVIAVLVATATYQVGINPPGGTWQDDTRGSGGVKEHMAGGSILGSYSSTTYTVFAAFNSLGFTLSLVVIGVLTSKFPLRVEFQICLVALYVTYNTAVVYMAPESAKVFIIVFTSVLPTLVPVVVNLWRNYLS